MGFAGEADVVAGGPFARQRIYRTDRESTLLENAQHHLAHRAGGTYDRNIKLSAHDRQNPSSPESAPRQRPVMR